MINVSSEFKQLMNIRTDFKENAEVTFADGTFLELTEKDFTVSNNSLADAAESNSIPLGVAVCRNVQIELMNDDDRFSDYDFFGAKIRLYLTFQLSETVERIEYGTFTVLTPETYGTTVIITALDDMHKADKEYSTTLPFPATIKSILVDACNTLGISLGTTSFLNDDFVVQSAPTDITFRQIIGYIAMIAGGNARIDTTGRLRIISYDFEKMAEVAGVIDGGIYSPWNNPAELDGGSFSPWNDGDVADGGLFTDRKEYHVLSNWSNLKVDTDDVVITGVQTTYTDSENEEHSVLYGVEGYVLSVENPLIVGQEEYAVGLIGNVMVGGRFRQFSGDLVANPTIEFMDRALILDRKGNAYASFVTDINFQFFGFTSIKNSAEPALRNSAKPYSDATQTLVKARNLMKNERTAREKAVEQLAKDLQNSSGLFMTQEKQDDGSVIYYMHDKSTLSESMIVWKLTALAFGISTDGGKTYPYGFTVDGTTITRLLYAEGIDADYIDTGAIRITDSNGNTIFLADYDTKEVYINASTVKIGSKAITDEFVEQAAAISLNASNISAEINRASSAEGNLSTRINANAGSIEAEVSRAQGQEVELAAAISLIDDKVELKASKGELSSLLSVESGAVSIKSNRFSWESTYSSLSADGKLTAKDADLTGKIKATSGEIAGLTISSEAIYSGKTSFSNDSEAGVYLGKDGFSIGTSENTCFRVSRNGDALINGHIDIKVGTSSLYSRYESTKATFAHGKTSLFSEISYEHLKMVGSSSSAFSELTSGALKIQDNSSNYAEITGSEVSVRNGSSYGRMTYNKLELTSGATIEATGAAYGKINIAPYYAILGKSGGCVGFFGDDGDSKKTVSNIVESTATVSTLATKLNDLLTALRAYNLIG